MYEGGRGATIGRVDQLLESTISNPPTKLREKCAVTNVVNGNGVLVEYREDGTEKYRDTYKDGKVVETKFPD